VLAWSLGHEVMPAVKAGDCSMRWTLNGKVFSDIDLLFKRSGRP